MKPQLGPGLRQAGANPLVVHLPGHLQPLELRRILRDVSVPEGTLVVLDFACVPEIGETVLAVLATTQRRLRRHGARLALWRLRTQPRCLVAAARFCRVVEVIDGEPDGWPDHRVP